MKYNKATFGRNAANSPLNKLLRSVKVNDQTDLSFQNFRLPKKLDDLYLHPASPICRSRAGVTRYTHDCDKDGRCVFCDKLVENE